MFCDLLFGRTYIFLGFYIVCLVGAKKRGGGGEGIGQLPFSFSPDYPPLLAPARQAWFYKKEQMMEMSCLRGRQTCPLYYISMLISKL